MYGPQHSWLTWLLVAMGIIAIIWGIYNWIDMFSEVRFDLMGIYK